MIGNKLGPVDRTVQVLIDRSYPVVKEVYLRLKEILAVYEGLDSITFVSEHLEEIKNLQTAADRVNRVWESIDNIDTLTSHVSAINDIVQHLDEINTIANKLSEILESGTQAIAAKEAAEQSAKEAAEAREAVEASQKEIKKLADSLDQTATKLDADIEAVKQAQAEANRAAIEAKTAAENAVKAAESAIESAYKAGYSFRYSALLTDQAEMDIASLYPNDNAKVGDHVVNAKGEVYQIESIEGLSFTVGFKITSLMGPEGPKGDGLELTEALPSYEQLLQTYPKGTAGQIVLVGNQIYAWSTTLNKWIPSGELNIENVPPASIAWDNVTGKPPLASFDEISNTSKVGIEITGMTYSEIQ